VRRGRPKDIDAAKGLTQYEVAAILGLSRARVMQIEQRAIRKLRAAAAAMGLTFSACTPSTPPVTPPPPDASDAATGVAHTYTCPVNDAGVAWTCQDGVSTPIGTCSSYGCMLVP
jgi:DNA-binding XRE family transcriptional regulator